GRADLFSLGVVLHECLTGAPPWTADTPAATALARLHQTPPPIRAVRADVPRQIERVIQRSLRVDPGERFRDARSFRAALQESRQLAGATPPGPDATAAAADATAAMAVSAPRPV